MAARIDHRLHTHASTAISTATASAYHITRGLATLRPRRMPAAHVPDQSRRTASRALQALQVRASQLLFLLLDAGFFSLRSLCSRPCLVIRENPLGAVF